MSFNLDENDVLFTNQFIPEPNISDEIDQSLNNEFKKYYETERDNINEERIKKSVEQISFQSLNLSDDTDEHNLLHTNKLDTSSININDNTSIKRFTKEVKTYVSIDSRDRNKLVYNHAHEFKIFLGKTFYNVSSVRLSSMEFPNTSAVINNTNNKIYWRNKQDIDQNIINNFTQDYPIYEVTLRNGSYIASSLASELKNKLSSIKRENGNTATYHYFDATLDIDTDVVTLTSLILRELLNNPFSTTKSSGIISIKITGHGFSAGDTIYIVGAKTFAGINTNIINTSHIIQTVLNANEFTIEINVNASDTIAEAGGNTVKIGTLAPFQLLFGENSNTVAQNIGFPLENSSERVNIHINYIENFYQIQITLSENHPFTNNYNYIGQTCEILNSNTIPSINGIKTITQIIDNKTLLISNNNKLTIESLNSGQLIFNGITYNISEIIDYNIETILITTNTEHFLEFSSIFTKKITLYNTETLPNFDGENTLYGILSPTQFVIPGKYLSGPDGSSSGVGDNCTMPQSKPLTTHIYSITGITIGSTNTLFSCNENHNLLPGDSIIFSNIITNPLLNSIYTIESVPVSPNLFTINTVINSYSSEPIQNETVIVRTGYMILSFPNHGFNNIISIQNTSGSPINNPSAKLLLVQTKLPHNLSVGQKIYLSGTNCNPTKNDGFTVETVLDDDLFTISSNNIITVDGTEGIIGLNHNFYLYNATDVGGIISTNINYKLFTVRKIIDENTISFYNTYDYALSSEIGGGENLYISSLLHGFDGVQTNTKNNVLNRSINLQGENYVFLCCPQLATMMNTGSVKDVFARITLDQSPGNMVFAYLSNPKTFDTVPLDKLNELYFTILNYNGSPYDFNDLDYSFTLEITEIKDVTEGFNYSSRRGITNINTNT